MPKYNLESDETIELWYQSRLSLKIETNVIIFIKENKNILIFENLKNKQTKERGKKERKKREEKQLYPFLIHSS